MLELGRPQTLLWVGRSTSGSLDLFRQNVFPVPDYLMRAILGTSAGSNIAAS
ncbi:hypothetical protein SAMN05428943_1091 [Streptomyces sp. 2314.4]|nr:hypothetical protein SAMN05428943_1091 [Streptomyces sp. 2314.4]